MPIVSNPNAVFGHRSLVESMKGYPAPTIHRIYPYFDQYGSPSLQQNPQMQFGLAGTSTPPYQSSHVSGAYDIHAWHQLANNQIKSSKRKLDDTQLPVSKIRRKSKADKRVQKPPKRHVKSFPEKLMKSLTENPNEDAVAWLPDGKSFVVVNPTIFTEKVLKKVFLKESKYSSFVRKLNRWGFVRLTSGTGLDCFHQPLFRKNRPDLASLISCTPRMSNARNGVDSAVIAAGLEKDASPSLAGIDRFMNHQSSTMTPSNPITELYADGETQGEKKTSIDERQ